MAQLAIGQICRSTDNDLGNGRAIGADTRTVTIEYFDRPGEEGTSKRQVSRASVRRVGTLKPQTRCYVKSVDGGWLVGRVLERVGDQYHVRFPNNQNVLLDERAFFVRWSKPVMDPVSVLVSGGHESPFFSDRRRGFIRHVISQRSASRGLEGVLSSVAELHPHQVDVAARVLLDPVRRFLLADEVGLGKTIEAGFVIRQTLLESPEATVGVLVPRLLVAQWREELDRRFLLTEVLRERCTVLAHETLELWPILKSAQLLVVDEAHRVVGERGHSDSEHDLRELAHSTRDLLLLSATPLLHNEGNFLALLNLIDPVSHPIDQVDEFRAQIAERRRIGLVFHAFTPTAPSFILKSHVQFFRDTFPEDRRLQGFLDEIESALRGEADVQEAVHAARVHVSETYRLHRRVLRNRRDSERCSNFPIRGRVDPTPIADPDPYRRWISDWFDRWRERFTADHRDASGGQARVVVDALERTGSLPLAMRGFLVSRRTSEESPSSTEEFRLLDELEEHLGSVELSSSGRLALIVNALETAPAGSKIVLFTGFTEVAERLVERIADGFGGTATAAHHGAIDPAQIDAEIRRFRSDPSCRFLISDASGEEGRNFQFASTLVHVDLPWNPNRLEQRIGRVDRYGPQGPANSIVFEPVDSDTYEAAWIGCLTRGFGVFGHSIASLQFPIDAAMRKLLPEVVVGGVDAVHQATVELPDDLRRERAAISEIESIESIEDETAIARGLYASLSWTDEHWHDFQATAEDYLGDGPGGLRFYRVMDEAQPMIRKYEARPSGKTPHVNNMPLVPWDWLAADFREGTDAWGTYSRALANQRVGIRLFRLGDPMISALHRFSEWDDRGKAYVMWRSVPEWQGDPMVAFRLDYVLEPDLEATDGGDPALDREALRRLAEQHLPVSLSSQWLGPDGAAIADPEIVALLEADYSHPGDININPSRRAHVEDILGTDWGTICGKISQAAEANILASTVVLDRIDEAGVSAAIATRQVVQRYELRKIAGLADPVDHDREILVRNAVERVIERPRLRVDSVGVVVLAADLPSADDT